MSSTSNATGQGRKPKQWNGKADAKHSQHPEGRETERLGKETVRETPTAPEIQDTHHRPARTAKARR